MAVCVELALLLLCTWHGVLQGNEVGKLVVRLTPFVGDKPPEPGSDNPMQEDRIDLLLGSKLGIVVRTRCGSLVTQPSCAGICHT